MQETFTRTWLDKEEPRSKIKTSLSLNVIRSLMQEIRTDSRDSSSSSILITKILISLKQLSLLDLIL